MGAVWWERFGEEWFGATGLVRPVWYSGLVGLGIPVWWTGSVRTGLVRTGLVRS